MCGKLLQSCPTAILWTVAFQATLSMGFSRQEYWSGLLLPSSGDLPDPGIEPGSLMSPVLAGQFFTTSATLRALSFFLPWQLPVSGPDSMVIIRL